MVEGGLSSSLYSAWSRSRRRQQFHPQVSAEVQALAEQSQLFRDMRAITRQLTITRVEQGEEYRCIVAEDLAVRHFGGKFGRTELHFDSSAKLRREEANI